jgi:hypothetical protein
VTAASTAHVPTPAPERYVKQIVAHLGRKRTARMLESGDGEVRWPDGSCDLTCRPGLLVLTATADDADALARIQDVVGRHLERFGARAGLRVEWTPPG